MKLEEAHEVPQRVRSKDVYVFLLRPSTLFPVFLCVVGGLAGYFSAVWPFTIESALWLSQGRESYPETLYGVLFSTPTIWNYVAAFAIV